ncbi:hypothetical protein EV126DRAFT_18393 [Verticillium dahliae]|nr:hypothetical protein EV126DRAFT_18393 [Verticillium dahliae]
MMMSHLSLNLERPLYMYASDGAGDWDQSTMCIGRSLDSGQSLYRDAHTHKHTLASRAVRHQSTRSYLRDELSDVWHSSSLPRVPSGGFLVPINSSPSN